MKDLTPKGDNFVHIGEIAELKAEQMYARLMASAIAEDDDERAALLREAYRRHQEARP